MTNSYPGFKQAMTPAPVEKARKARVERDKKLDVLVGEVHDSAAILSRIAAKSRNLPKVTRQGLLVLADALATAELRYSNAEDDLTDAEREVTAYYAEPEKKKVAPVPTPLPEHGMEVAK
jgi:hypothetical protein